MNATQSLKQLLLTIQTDRKYYIALEKLLLKQRQYVIRYQSAKFIPLAFEAAALLAAGVRRIT